MSSTSPLNTNSISSNSHSMEHNNQNSDLCQNQLQNSFSTYSEPILCIAPPIDVQIHRPYVTLTDFLNSNSICLNSYEERIEATVRGESLCAEHITNVRETIKSNTKRQRHDSGSEKKSPDTKRAKPIDNEKYEQDVTKKSQASSSQDGMSTISNEDIITNVNEDRDFSSPTYENAIFDIDGVNHMPIETSSADECERNDELNSVSDIKKEINEQKILTLNKATKKSEQKSNYMNKKRSELRTNNRETYRPLINEEIIQKIRKGWNIYNIGDICVGDLYIMFGSDSKLRLEYKWITPVNQMDIKTEATKIITQKNDSAQFDCKDMADDEIKTENLMINTVSGSSNDDAVESKPFSGDDVKPRNILSNKLKQLLLLAGMMEKTKRKNSCSCGHYCDRGNNKMKV